MRLLACIYICVCACACLCALVHACACACACVRVRVGGCCACVCMFLCACACVRVRVRVYACAHACRVCSLITLPFIYSQVTLSSIFKWYASDFGATITDQLEYISKHLSESKREALNSALIQYQQQHGKPLMPRHKDYDWSVNDL